MSSSVMMMGRKKVGVGVWTVVGMLGCVMVAVLAYTITTDGLPFRKELLARWMAALLIDFYINIAAIGAWIVYKESSWIIRIIWVILLISFGSVTTCGYIVLQFFKLTPEQFSKDPFYFVLATPQNSVVTEHKKGLSVVTARVIFAVLGCLMLGTLLYTIIVDGSPFRAELYTPIGILSLKRILKVQYACNWKAMSSLHNATESGIWQAGKRWWSGLINYKTTFYIFTYHCL